ncbi:hypothetical protein [Empedobacter tilapiae]|uniref:Uncharacterized protein n=1 Tax=Empedobacter tilapiae TaxID=2491114 RepID=A0A4Z1BK71_9FLAO|nr:hypothetical protein [Empedobacter tilapiae]TGN24352.1 hypothetical protein E4J94_14010 [Empedobacter tilapiae]
MKTTNFFLNQEQIKFIKNIFETDSNSKDSIFYKNSNYINNFTEDKRYLKIKDVFDSGKYGLTKSQRNYILINIDIINLIYADAKYKKILREIENILRDNNNA